MRSPEQGRKYSGERLRQASPESLQEVVEADVISIHGYRSNEGLLARVIFVLVILRRSKWCHSRGWPSGHNLSMIAHFGPDVHH